MMKRIAVLALAISLVLIGLIGCAPAEEAQAEAALDEAIHEVEHLFTEFYLLGPDASVSEIRSTTDELALAWAEVQAAASDIDSLDIDEAETAYEELAATIAGLDPEDEGAMQVVVPKMDAFKAGVEILHESGEFH